MEIKAKEIRVVPIKDIHPNPDNRNLHSEEQIERLAKIIKHQGFRSPLIISMRSGLLVAGHGRLLAAKKLGLKKLPVIYQEFKDKEEEYACGIADNAISNWANLDLANINLDIIDFGPDINLDLLGIEDFELEPMDKKKKEKLCPHCGEAL